MPYVHLVTTAHPTEGRGHAARATTLAEALAAAGERVAVSFLRGRPTPSEARRLSSIGASTFDGSTAADVVIVDLPDPNMGIAGRDPDSLVVFDDRELLRGPVNTVVQPSLPNWHGRAKAGKVLVGYRWAPVSSAWRVVREASKADVREAGNPRWNVLVCFGGSDPAGVTARLSPEIAADDRWSTTVVLGHDQREFQVKGALTVRDPRDLPTLVAQADIVVIGAGTMKFEVACVGRPALLAAAAMDQLTAGPPFAATGAAVWLGDGTTIEPEAVRDAVAVSLGDVTARIEMSRRARQVVDGLGAERLTDAVLEIAARR